MKLESPKQTIDRPAAEVFDFLNDVKNFETLMPENIVKFEMLNEDTFLFALQGMPEIELKKLEAVAPHKIVLGASGGKLDFSLTGHIVEIAADKSDVQLIFEGDFNPMIAMMVKGPIKKLIETWTSKIPGAL